MKKEKKPMHILGIHFCGHDTSACVVKDGVLLAFAEEERFDHKKHTVAFPHNAIKYCLDTAGIRASELDYVAYATDPESTNIEKMKYKEEYKPDFEPVIINEDDLRRQIREELGISGEKSVKLQGVDHHMAHAASSFLSSPFKSAAVVTIDGMGNWLTTTIGTGEGIEIKRLCHVSHPHSVGLFYGAATQFLGFKAASGEAKVMGLACYGKPRYVDVFRKMVRIEDGYNIRMDLKYFTFHKIPLMKPDGTFNLWYSEAFKDLFGSPRAPESAITERDEDIAHSTPQVCEELVYAILNEAYRRTKNENLCLAGGVALNCSMNGKIQANTPFKNLFIPPIVNDAGLSAGAALFIYNVMHKNPRKYEMKTAYLGPSFSNDECRAALEKNGLKYEYRKDIAKATAGLLDKGKIIGWFQGRMECGPRALGNRSILADARNPQMKDIINNRVKFRENFRPFAPAVIIEDVDKFFHLNQHSPFMLQARRAREDKWDVIPSVVHVDKTSRAQTVKKDENPVFYELLKEFKKLTGVSVILNTSFNIRGDTMTCNPEDAINCFLKTGLD